MAARRSKAKVGGDRPRDAAKPVAADSSTLSSPGPRRLPLILLANVLTVAMLSLSFAPFDAWWLAYLSLVPWTVAVVLCPRRGLAVLTATAAGVVFWAANLYWLWWITLVGYFALVAYLTIYWLAAAMLIRSAGRRGWPMWLVLPVVWVAMEFARNWVISGFPWFFLAHSQYQITPLIQIADATGQFGVSFFVAMVNGALVDAMLPAVSPHYRQAVRFRRRLIVAASIVSATTAGLLAYGGWRLGQAAQSSGPAIALVQRTYPIWLGVQGKSEQEIFFSHAQGSLQFLDASADLILWPESMLVRWMNPEAMAIDPQKLSGQELRGLAAMCFGPEAWDTRYSEPFLREALPGVLGANERQQSAEAVALLTQRLGAPLLAGGGTLLRNDLPPVDRDDVWVTANSALWFDPGANSPSGLYSKMHLVPFSEYVPFKRSWPWLYRQLRSFVPAVMTQLEPGREAVTFPLERPGGRYRVGVAICYEGTFDRVCREICRNMIDRDGGKNGHVLVNLSNDGWFIWKWFSRDASSEQAQHLAQYCFRAVENRVPVVRAVNTGISASIDSCGRLVATLQRDGRRENISGEMLLSSGKTGDSTIQQGPQVLVDSRTSLYSLCGNVFAAVVSVLTAGMAGWLCFRRPRKTRIGS